MIDRLRKEIQERLDQLLSEADKLRGALAALDPRAGRAPRESGRTPSRSGGSAPSRRASASSSGAARRTGAARRPAPAGRTRRRTAPGVTRRKILQALAGGDAMTAGEVAAATGLGRGTVSTTLSKLTKSGEVLKAERGYRLPEARAAS